METLRMPIAPSRSGDRDRLFIDAADELFTVRDIIRYGVSRFRAAGLAFGHGTDNAFDDMVFLALEGLNLPVDQLEPYWDARLLRQERTQLLALIERRIDTRKPTSYLLNKAYIQGVPFYVDERVIVPRSYIGELLFSNLFGGEGFNLVPDVEAVGRVLDLCTGSGCLAILAAQVFPNAIVDAVDLSGDALDVARRNVADHGLEDRVNLYHGDLFAPLPDDAQYDLIITNPPYVDAAAMAVLPAEYRAEPEMALAAGDDGLDVVMRILAEAGERLTPGGGLICEIGRDRPALEERYEDLPFLWLQTAGSFGEVFWLTAEQLADADL
jgi:ribosomal protein L3 glutamine methyltransferase